MTGGIRNPVKLPTDLNPAEEYFTRCLAEGEPCKIGNGELPEKAIESGEGANVVRSEVIRFFAYGGNEDNPVLGPEISLRGAWISGDLDLMHASIPYALDFSNCRFVASVVMLHMECAALYLNGSSLVQGLLADGLTTKGSVYLRRGFSAEGEVRLLGANINGDLDCMGGKFQNAIGNAIHADGLTTKGNVNFRSGFFAEGEVRLLSANIGGNLDCEGGKFQNAIGNAIHADGLTTKGSVHLRNGFSAEGKVRLVGVNIGRILSCEGGKFYNADGKALNVDRGNISGGLVWRKTICKGDVHLAYAKVDVLADDSDSWESCKVILSGFTYNRFSNPMDASFRIGWLAKRPDGEKFSPQPYEQAAKVLFGMGHSHNAREILLKKERLQTKDGQMPWLQIFVRWLWDIFVGYGYRLHYTLGWMAFIIYVGTSVFLDADLQHRIVPRQSTVLENPGYQSAIRKGARPTELVPAMFPDYPEFNQFWFSMDIFIPLFNLDIDLNQETHWHLARDEPGSFPWLTWWYWIEIAAGWGLTSLLLLSSTGLLRPR